MIYGHGTVEKRFFPLEKSLTHRARGATLEVGGGGGGGLTQPGFNTFLSTIDDLNWTLRGPWPNQVLILSSVQLMI